MAETLSPLAHLAAGAGGGAVLREESATILRIQAWPDTLATVRDGLAAALDLQPPPIGQAAIRSGITLAAPSPGTFLLIGADAEMLQRIESRLPAAEAATTRLSHGRTLLALEGPRAADVLQRCVALDLAPSRFPPGRVAETPIHHVGVLIHRRTEDAFALLVPRSFALALAEWLLDAGSEHGASFRR